MSKMKSKPERVYFLHKEDLINQLFKARNTSRGYVFFHGQFEVHVPTILPDGPDCPLHHWQRHLKWMRGQKLDALIKRLEKAPKKLFEGSISN
jgi:hypothetical protein